MTSQGCGPAHKSPNSRVWVLLFCLIPPLFTFLGTAFLFHERELWKRKDQERRLEKTLRGMDEFANPSKFMGRLLGTVERRVFSGSNARSRFARIRKTLHRRFPGVFSFVFLDGKGEPAPGLCDDPVPRILSKRFFFACRALLEGLPPPQDPGPSFLKSFLGEFSEIHRGGFRTIQMGRKIAKKRYLYLGRPSAQGMMIVFLSETSRWPFLAIQDRVRRLNRESKGTRIGVFHRATRIPEIARTMGASTGTIREILDELETGNCASIINSGRTWAKREVGRGIRILGCRAVPNNPAEMVRRTRAIIGLVVAGSLAFLTAFGLSSGRMFGSLSVRLKLILAFAYTAAIPLSLMAWSSGEVLRERRVILEDALHDSVETALEAFDRNFQLEFDRIESEMRQVFYPMIYNEEQTPMGLKKSISDMQPRFAWDSDSLHDESGKEIILPGSPPSHFGGTRPMAIFDRTSKFLLRILNTGTSTAPLSGPSGESDTEGLPPEFESILARVGNELGKISAFDIGGKEFLNILFPIHDRNSIARFFLSIFWRRDDLARNYVRRNLAAFGRTLEEGTVFAFDRENPELSFPADFRRIESVRRFLDRVRAGDRGLRETAPGEDGDLLVTGFRCRELSQFNLLAVSSDRGIRLELGELGASFLFSGLFILFGSVTVGGFLASIFLVPIRDLSDGVEAIRQRRFETRIPVGDQDELGKLSATFNWMMTGLQDLEPARAVQEHLFPREALRSGNWEVFGTSQPLSQIGGDYFDYIVTSDGRLILIIGDVVGHGIASGLVMAMAKTVFFHPRTPKNPGPILETLNQVFLKTFSRETSMTCCCLSFDPKSGSCTVANGGHPHPVLIRSGKAVSLESKGFILGIIPSKGYPENRYELVPGDCVVFFTDGMVESPLPGGGVIGFPRWFAALPTLVGKSAGETEQSIRRWYGLTVGNQRPPDDLTVMILQCPVPEPTAGGVR